MATALKFKSSHEVPFSEKSKLENENLNADLP
jgi:hypothetical protein